MARGRPLGAQHQLQQYGEVCLGEAATGFRGGSPGIQINPNEDTQSMSHSILQEKVRKPTA